MATAGAAAHDPGAAPLGPGAAPLDLAAVERGLCARRRLARTLEAVAECASTSDRLREALVSGALPSDVSHLVVAETQSGGRGRRARDWWSGPPHANLACTLLVPDPPQPPLLVALAGACALAAAVTRTVAAPVALKWPNDLLVGGAKAGGLLGEVPAEGRGAALLGLGLNVAAAPLPESLPYPATCLHAHPRPGASRVTRERLLVAWLWGMERRLLRLAVAGPAELERECLGLLRTWAPRGVRAAAGAGAAPEASASGGPLLEFTVSGGLSWGVEGAIQRRPLGQVPPLEAL